MSYTVDDINFIITQDAGTTNSDLSGLEPLVDSFAGSVVTTTGGDYAGLDGVQKIYSIIAPYTFNIEGTQTISPRDEQLVLLNTTQVSNKQDLRVNDSGILNIDGEFTNSGGTWYTKATWIRFNRRATSSSSTSLGLYEFSKGATVNWLGGTAVGYGVTSIAGGTPSNTKTLTNGFWEGLSTAMFRVNGSADIAFSGFTVINNRFVDDRSNITVDGYQAINSLIEGGNFQTFTNYGGVVAAASWTRKGVVRTFTNPEAGMELVISAFTSNLTQRGGLIKILKDVSLVTVDKDKTPITDVKLTALTYNNGDRIDYVGQDNATDIEISDFTNQVAVANIQGSVSALGAFSFTAPLKEFTARDNVAVVQLSNVTGSYTRNDLLDWTGDGSINGKVLYWDGGTTLSVQFTTNSAINGASIIQNLSQFGSGTTIGVAVASGNAECRFTKGGVDSQPFGDVLSVSYLYSFTTVELDYSGINTLSLNIFNLPDGALSESDVNIVKAYTSAETTQKVYNNLKFALYDSFENFVSVPLDVFVKFTSIGGVDYLDFGSLDVVLDNSTTPLTSEGAVSINLAASSTTIYLNNNRFKGNITTTGAVTGAGRTSSDGIIVDSGGTLAPQLLLSVSNLVAGSRVKIHNETTGLTTFNDVVAGTAYSVYYDQDVDYSTGDILTVYAQKIDQNEFQATVSVSASGWSALAAQTNDSVYAALAIDGSTITNFSADYTALTVKITNPTDFTVSSFYAWWKFNLSSELGIDWAFVLVAKDQANFLIQNATIDLHIDNATTTNLIQTDNRRIYRDDEAYPALTVTSGGGGLDVNWRSTVIVAETATSGLTPAESAQLTNVDSLAGLIPALL